MDVTIIALGLPLVLYLLVYYFVIRKYASGKTYRVVSLVSSYAVFGWIVSRMVEKPLQFHNYVFIVAIVASLVILTIRTVKMLYSENSGTHSKHK